MFNRKEQRKIQNLHKVIDNLKQENEILRQQKPVTYKNVWEDDNNSKDQLTYNDYLYNSSYMKSELRVLTPLEVVQIYRKVTKIVRSTNSKVSNNWEELIKMYRDLQTTIAYLHEYSLLKRSGENMLITVEQFNILMALIPVINIALMDTFFIINGHKKEETVSKVLEAKDSASAYKSTNPAPKFLRYHPKDYEGYLTEIHVCRDKLVDKRCLLPCSISEIPNKMNTTNFELVSYCLGCDDPAIYMWYNTFIKSLEKLWAFHNLQNKQYDVNMNNLMGQNNTCIIDFELVPVKYPDAKIISAKEIWNPAIEIREIESLITACGEFLK